MTEYGRQKASTNFVLVVLLLLLGSTVILQYRERVLDRETIQRLEAHFRVGVTATAARETLENLVISEPSKESRLRLKKSLRSAPSSNNSMGNTLEPRRLLSPLYHGAPCTHYNQTSSLVPKASDERFFLYQPSGGMQALLHRLHTSF